MLISGGLAGMAGLNEVAGPIGQVVATISPGYGYTAIIVAFLGTAASAGIVISALLIALSYIGGDAGADVDEPAGGRVERVPGHAACSSYWVAKCLIRYRVRLNVRSAAS